MASAAQLSHDAGFALAQDLTFAEALKHGPRMAAWLHGQPGGAALAAQVLKTTEMAWYTRYSADPELGGTTDLPNFSQTLTLVDSGKQLARDGRHAEAAEMLTRAFLLTQMQLDQASRGRQQLIDEASGPTVVEAGRPGTYMNLNGHYGRMRDILRIYPALVAELRTAGKATEERVAADAGTRLRQLLQQQFTIKASGDIAVLADELTGRAMIAEITPVTNAKGAPALRIHGANGVEEDVTQLPGLPNPAEIQGRLQHSSLAEVGTALAAQVDLVQTLLDTPEVAKHFPDGDIDMGNGAHRLKVWKAMWGVLQQERGDQALTALMDLIERYLKAFTVHTDYNVRDFGVSYLDSEMPQDLAGRAEQDCGVYALTVAYELFLTMRAGGPALDFTLVSVPGHVMLAIKVRGKDATFVVNNAEIEGPHTGSVEDLAARFVAPVFQHRFLVTPAMSTPIGGTDMKEPDFKKSAWEQFRDTSAWGLNIQPGPPGESPDKQRERTEAAYKEFYEGLDALDKLCGALQAGLDAASGTADAKLLEKNLARLQSTYIKAQTVFDLLRDTGWAGDEKSRPGVVSRLRTHDKILFLPGADPPHPLVRTVKALLRLQSQRGELGEHEQAMIAFWDSFPPFDKQVAAYRQAGMPATF
jgi:hypothetical protein